MPNEYGVVKIMPATEIKKPGWFPDVATTNKFIQMFTSARTGDRSSSEDWPKITKCFQRSPTTIAIDAQAAGFSASISFDLNDKGEQHSYMLRESPRGVERGIVENVIVLRDSPFEALPYSLLEACALEAYPRKFIVFTRADKGARAALWLIGISEFSTVPESV